MRFFRAENYLPDDSSRRGPNLAETELGGGLELCRGEEAALQARPGGGGNHGCVVSRKGEGREGNGEAPAGGLCRKPGTQLTIGRDAA